jgi:CRP/FNR family cyclic AMP-dependent transcriptional regulator
MKWFEAFFKDVEFRRKRRFLRGVLLFKEIPDREMGGLVQALFEKTYQEGETLFEEGDIGRALFIVETGSVELLKRGHDGTWQSLAVAQPGDFFGEMALLEELPRSASARALEESKVHLLYKAKLDALLLSRPRVAVPVLRRLAQLLSARVRLASEQLVSGAIVIQGKEG